MLFGSGGALAKLQQGVGGVVLEEGLEEHANGAKDTDEDEDPQEEAVDDHGHVLPVLAHLCGAGKNAGSGWGLRYCLTLPQLGIWHILRASNLLPQHCSCLPARCGPHGVHSPCGHPHC